MSQAFNPHSGLIQVQARVYGPAGDTVVRLALDTGATATIVGVGLLVALPFGAVFATCIGSCVIQGNAGVAIALMTFIGMLLLASIVCAVVALFGMRQYGTEGILLKSIVGLCLAFAIIAWWVWSFFQVG